MEIKRTIAWHIYTEVNNVFRVVNDIKIRSGVYIRKWWRMRTKTYILEFFGIKRNIITRSPMIYRIQIIL